MKFLKDFQIFERKKLDEYDDLMGRLLHLYGSIPLEKEKASVVISKIVFNTIGKYYKLGDDVNIRHQADHDKVRFKDYFDSLLKSKDSRGHNFEGTLAGLYDGDLSERGEKWDITIEGKTWSVKFIDNPAKAPEIGSFNKVILDASKQPKEGDRLSLYYPNLHNDIMEEGGLTKLFRSDNRELKEKAFNVISHGITGGWIIAYPIKSSKNDNINIQLNIIKVDEMKEMLVDKKMSVAPKAGIKSKFTLALSAKFKYNKDITKSIIKIPILPLSKLKEIARSNNEIEWAEDIFGPKYGSKIRPDVLRYIKNNSEDIGNKLLSYKKFNNQNETPEEI